MLVIGNSSGFGNVPTMSLARIRRDCKSPADILAVSVYLTADNVPVVMTSPVLSKKQGFTAHIRTLTYSELRETFSKNKVILLRDVLEIVFGKRVLLLRIEEKDSVVAIMNCVEPYCNAPEDWENILFASRRVRELQKIRLLYPRANIAMLQRYNPFAFVAHHRQLSFTAVGFHRLHTNPLALEITKRAGIFSFVFTVNRVPSIEQFVSQGFDGVVTERVDEAAALFD